MKKIMVLVLGSLLATACQAEPPKPVVPPVVQQTGGPGGCSAGIYGTTGVGQVVVQFSGEKNSVVSSDSGGSYIFTRLAPGTYRIEIQSPGDYKALSPTIVSVNLAEACSLVKVDFELSQRSIDVPATVPGAPPVVPSSTGNVTTPSQPTILDEVRKLWPKAELPVKETMFLAGKLLIGPLASLLWCLRIFGYIFAVIYCLVVIQWQINHRGTSWQEFMDDFLLGAPGKMLFVVSIIAAPVVYLTALHDFAQALWITDDGYMREALGWKLVGFSPDLDPESMFELLMWLPEWVALHGTQEIMLMVGFIIAVILAGLQRNLGPLRIWGVAYLMYAVYGLAVYTAVIFVDSVRGADLVGNNIVWSSFVRINKMFVASTKGLWYLMAYIIPGCYAIYDMFFASRGARPARPAGTTTSQDVLNAIQTLAIWLGLSNRPPAPAPAPGGSGAWGMGAQYPHNYAQLGGGSPGLPDGTERTPPPPDKGPKGKTPRDGRDVKDAPDPHLSDRGLADKKAAASPKKLNGSTSTLGGSSMPVRGSWWQVELTSEERRSAAGGSEKRQPADRLIQEPEREFRLIGDQSDLENGGHAVFRPFPTALEENDVLETREVQEANQAPGQKLASTDSDQRALPDDEKTVPAQGEGDLTPAAEATGDQPATRAGEATYQKARMKEKVGDLEEGEPVLIVASEGKAMTIDGMEIPLDQLTLEPKEGGNA